MRFLCYNYGVKILRKAINMKKLVVYYSFEGNTRLIAEIIANLLSADVLELKPSKELSTHGFMKYFWGGKQVFMKEKPELLPLSKNPDDYDLIFIGTPVWSFTFAPPLASFFEKVKLSGKKLVLFCTHSGGMKNTLYNMERMLKGNEVIAREDFLDVLKNKGASIRKAESFVDKFKCV